MGDYLEKLTLVVRVEMVSVVVVAHVQRCANLSAVIPHVPPRAKPPRELRTLDWRLAPVVVNLHSPSVLVGGSPCVEGLVSPRLQGVPFRLSLAPGAHQVGEAPR